MLVLAALAAALISDGSRSVPSGADGPERVGAERRAFDAARADGHLARLNPQLTDAERRRIASAVMKYSAKYALDPSLVLAVIAQESTARPWARSSKGAMGLMQVMPHMMVTLPVAGNLTSIESNIEAGCIILADNIRRLGEERGILAYFWGNDIRGVSYLEGVQQARARLQ